MTLFFLSTLSVIHTNHMGNLLIAPSPPQLEDIICKKDFKEVSTPNATPKALSNLLSHCLTQLHYSHKATISSHIIFCNMPSPSIQTLPDWHRGVEKDVLPIINTRPLLPPSAAYRKAPTKSTGKKFPASTS